MKLFILILRLVIEWFKCNFTWSFLFELLFDIVAAIALLYALYLLCWMQSLR